MSKIHDSAIVRHGWHAAIDRLGFYVVSVLISIGVWILPIILMFILILSRVHWIFILLLMVANFFLYVLLYMGWLNVTLMHASGKNMTYADLFQPRKNFWKFLGTVILNTLITLGGTILFIIPGQIWYLKFYYAPYFVIDKGMSPLEALKASARATEGFKWDLFGFFYTTQTIVSLGSLVFGIGVIATYPAMLIAAATSYRKLS